MKSPRAELCTRDVDSRINVAIDAICEAGPIVPSKDVKAELRQIIESLLEEVRQISDRLPKGP